MADSQKVVWRFQFGRYNDHIVKTDASQKVAMPAQREPRADHPTVGTMPAGARTARGSVLPWPRVSSPAGRFPDSASGSRLGPARGLLLGLLAGLILWLLIGLAAWAVFRLG